jgi:hypothetical protein
MGTELFLYDRALEDCLDRLSDIARRFERCLLIGCPSPDWLRKLTPFVREIDVVDPGKLFAAAAGGTQIEEDRFDFGEGEYDLAVAVGTLDSVNDLPLALKLIHRALRSDSPLIGAMAGGNSLPALRASMIEAGRAVGRIVGRTHPRIDASSLAGLVSAAGFSTPVVDVDRLTLRYSGLLTLIKDLRAMGATSALAQRPPSLTRREVEVASTTFEQMARDGRTEERIEILHFIGWRQ